MTFSIFISGAIFIYGFVFLNFGLATLLIKHKKAVHYWGIALLIDFGLMCISGGVCVYIGLQEYWSNIGVFLPMLSLSIIGSGFAIECLGKTKRALGLLKIIILGTLLIFLTCVYLIFLKQPWRLVFSLVYAWLFVVYFFLGLVEGYELKPIKKMPKWLLRFYMLVWIVDILVLGMFLCQPFDFYSGLYCFWVLLITCILFITFIAFRAPDAYHLIEAEVTKIKYERSRLNNHSVESLLGKLRNLMVQQELFTDPDLDLETLATALQISSAQLSELINLHLGLNFSGYMNNLRVEKAKKLLLEKKDLSILDVAFECGFSSKSNFNFVFNKILKMSPTEYKSLISNTSKQ